MKWLVTLLTLVAFAAVPTLAQAKPTPSVSNQYSDIPYLSHGIGVDEQSFGGTPVQNGPSEIPYLSHGVGVDEQSLGLSISSDRTGVAVDDRAVPRSTPQTTPIVLTKDRTGVSVDDRALPRSTPQTTPIVLTKSDGWSVDFGNPGFAALALMLGLLAGATAAAMWSRKGRLTPA